jgi:type VI secretion system secreted protein VgrG
LNLGNLSHPKETETSEGRGEGFELRTDQWGAIRAGEGLLLSSHKQDQAAGTHLNAQPAKQQLEGTLNNSQALSEVAKNQQTDPLEVLENLKGFLEQIEQQDQNKADAFKQAIMILSAPNSVAVSSNEDIYLSADGQISQSAGESINLSTQKSLIAHASEKISLFAAQDGLRAYAGKGKVEIQAQGDALDVIARKDIQIISTEEQIEIKANKKIVLTAGGSQIEISGAGVLPTTAGKFEVKAGQHQFLGGESVHATIPLIPKSGLHKIQFELRDTETQELLPFTFYMLMNDDGHISYGKTDANGLTQAFVTDKQENYYLHAINNKIKKLDN